MDSARLQMLQELMREARATGELESSLAATSVMPVPKRPNRKNVHLADFNLAVANMAKPSASVQPPGIQSSGIQKAAIFRSNPLGMLDPQTVAKAVATPVEGPGLRSKTSILPQFFTIVRSSPVKNVHFTSVFHRSPV